MMRASGSPEWRERLLHRAVVLAADGAHHIEVDARLRRAGGRLELALGLSVGPDRPERLPTFSLLVLGATSVDGPAEIRTEHVGPSAVRVIWSPISAGRDSVTSRVGARLVVHAAPDRMPALGRATIAGRAVVPERPRRTGGRTTVMAAAMIGLVVLGAGIGGVEVRFDNGTFALAGNEDPVSTTTSAGPTATTTTVAPSPATTVSPAEAVATREAALLARVDPRSWATLIVPRLGVVEPVQRDVADRDLGRGVGHYPFTGRPGRNGNIGIAGHRTTPPAPFRHLDDLVIGDAILLVVGNEVHRYVVEDAGRGMPHRVVRPSAVSVLDSRGHPGLTLTTCTPVGSDEKRLIVFAERVAVEPLEREE